MYKKERIIKALTDSIPHCRIILGLEDFKGLNDHPYIMTMDYFPPYQTHLVYNHTD